MSKLKISQNTFVNFIKNTKIKILPFMRKKERSKRLDFQLPPDTMDDSKFKKFIIGSQKYQWKRG